MTPVAWQQSKIAVTLAVFSVSSASGIAASTVHDVSSLAAATELLRAEGRDVAWCACTAAGADAHAGHTETSVLLHLSPADVWVEESVVGNTAPLPELLPALRSGGVAAVSPVGVLGDATTASASEGARIFAEMVGSCGRRISTGRPGPGGMLA